MNANIQEQLDDRKRLIERLDNHHFDGLEQPMLTASNLHNAIADRTRRLALA